MKNFIPQQEKDNIVVLFEKLEEEENGIKSPILEKVIWVIEEDDYSNFKRFFTSCFPGNIQELKDYINRKKL